MKYILLALLLIPSTAHAYSYTAQELQTHCISDNPGYTFACAAFMLGTLQTTELYKDDICIPEGVNVLQIKTIFQKYAKEHPEKLHTPAANMLYTSISEAFCE